MPNSDKVLIHALNGCTGHLLKYLVSVRVVTVVGLVFFFPEMDETRHYRNFPTTHTFGGILVEKFNGVQQSAPDCTEVWRMSGLAWNGGGPYCLE